MYGLPKDFDGAFLVGRTLQMICFGRYQLYLHFDANITITIESAFSYKSDQIMDVSVQKSDLMELLEVSVSMVQGDENGTLSLLFSNGQTLKMYDTTEQYESYTITYEDKMIVV